MSSPPPPPADEISTAVWIAVGLGSAAAAILFLGLGSTMWRRYMRRASMQSNNMRHVSMPPSRALNGNGLAPSQLFAPAPGECCVEMPLVVTKPCAKGGR